MSAQSWAEFAGLFRNTRQAFLEHERSKAELKALMPEDAKEAIGHGIRAKRAIIGSALGASLRAGRALSDQLEPQLAANEGRSALKGFDGNVALRLQDAIHLGAAGVHAFGESRLRHALALHFLCELPGDDARHRLSLRGFADTVLAQKRIERRAPMGILFWSCLHLLHPFTRNLQIVSRRLLGLLDEAMHHTDTTVIDEKHQACDTPTWQRGANFPQATTQRPAERHANRPTKLHRG